MLSAIDRAPVQVVIDMLLMEVTLNEATSMGVQAYLQSPDASFIASNGVSTSIAASAPASFWCSATGSMRSSSLMT